MKRLVPLVLIAALPLCLAPSAFAQGGAAQCKDPFKLAHPHRLGGLTLPAGSYRINVEETGSLTCDQARQALQENLAAPGGTLADDWRLDIANRRFARADGSDA